MAKSGRHFLQIPGPTNVPDRVLRALSQADDRSSRARVRRARERGVERAQGDLPDLVARRHLPGLGHRRVGGLARQHALARRQGADVRDRPLRDAVERRSRRGLGLQVDFVAGDWRHGVDPAVVYAKLADDRGQAIKAVCVVHNETSTGVASRIADDPASRSTRARHPALLLVDTDLLARIDRLPPRGVGRRRHGRLLAEGADAAARHRLQRRSARRRSPRRSRRRCRARTGTGSRCSATTRPASSRTRRRPTSSTACARRCVMLREEGLDECRSRGTSASAAPTRARGEGVGPRHRRRRSRGIQRRADGGDDARGARCRRLPADRARAVRHVARHRPRQAQGEGLPHRPPRRLQRSDARRHARRRRDGPQLAGVPHKAGGVLAALESLAAESLAPVS